MKHVVVTRAEFIDDALFQKYFKVMKDTYFPSFASQTCKDFEIFVQSQLQHKDILEAEFKKFNLNATVFTPNKKNFFTHLEQTIKKNQYTIQTRHDCDDWASSKYIETIQQMCVENKDKYDAFLIQAVPTKLDYKTGLEYHGKIEIYSPKFPSMFLSLCQKNCNLYIYQEWHNKFSSLVPDVLTIEKGFVKWVIHGNNKGTYSVINSADTLA